MLAPITIQDPSRDAPTRCAVSFARVSRSTFATPRGTLTPSSRNVEVPVSGSRDIADETRAILQSLAALLKQAEQLHHSWVALPNDVAKSQGRDASARARGLADALPLLRGAVDKMAGVTRSAADETVGEALAARDGRYEGGSENLSVLLRIDESVCGAISADLFRVTPSEPQWVASIRTKPGLRIRVAEGKWSVLGEDVAHAKATGTLALRATEPEGSLVGTLTLEESLEGLPVNEPITFMTEWKSPHMRRLGVEYETQDGIQVPPTADFDGTTISVASIWAEAGFEVHEVGQRSVIPSPPNGSWHEGELHAVMERVAQASLDRRAWELHVLLLSRFHEEGILGIMFDTDASLPRQGCASFVEEFSATPAPVSVPRLLMRSIVHEMGHALNLAHPWAPPISRPDSLSIMNYPWKFPEGGEAGYWERFKYTFDMPELQHLRHGLLPRVIPGGVGFMEAPYWDDATADFAHADFADRSIGTLTLAPPQGGNLLLYGQPVYLQVGFTNTSGRPLDLPRYLLDPKASVLTLDIRRRTGDRLSAKAEFSRFNPIIHRDYAHGTDSARMLLQHGQSAWNNVHLTYGTEGFPFAEPGDYEVQAVVSLGAAGGVQYCVRSDILKLRVSHPKTFDEERDAMVLFRGDVGTYFTLGGRDAMDRTVSDLEEVRLRRQGRAPTITDPVVANIVRSHGLNAGRPMVQFHSDRMEWHPPNLQRAAELLGALDDNALRAFDASTMHSTRQLTTKLWSTLRR